LPPPTEEEARAIAEEEPMVALVGELWEKEIGSKSESISRSEARSLLLRLYQAVVPKMQDPITAGSPTGSSRPRTVWDAAIEQDLDEYCSDHATGALTVGSWQYMACHLAAAWVNTHRLQDYSLVLAVFFSPEPTDPFVFSSLSEQPAPSRKPKPALLAGTYATKPSGLGENGMSLVGFGMWVLHVRKVEQVDEEEVAVTVAVPPGPGVDAWGPASHVVLWVDPAGARDDAIGTVTMQRRKLSQVDAEGRYRVAGLEADQAYQVSVATVHGYDLSEDEAPLPPTPTAL